MAALSHIDRRRYRRLPMGLIGSFALSPHCSSPCRSTDISPGGVSLLASVAVPPGTRVVLQLKQLGRLVGYVRRSAGASFGIALQATTDERQKLTAMLTWFANIMPLDLSDIRANARVVPTSRASHLRLVNGFLPEAQIGDLSHCGALLATRLAMPERSLTQLENRLSRVVRTVKGGIRVSFLKPMEVEEFDRRLEQRTVGRTLLTAAVA